MRSPGAIAKDRISSLSWPADSEEIADEIKAIERMLETASGLLTAIRERLGRGRRRRQEPAAPKPAATSGPRPPENKRAWNTADREQAAAAGIRLKQFREASGLSQIQLAFRLGMSQTAVSALERGRDRNSERMNKALAIVSRVTKAGKA